MYKHASALPRSGFRPTGRSSAIDNGPTPEQQAARDAYLARIEAERQKNRALAARRRRSQPAP